MLELGFRNENQNKMTQMLEPMRPLVSSLQGELMEIYLGFKKIDQVIESYQLIRDDIDSWFNRKYAKVL